MRYTECKLWQGNAVACSTVGCNRLYAYAVCCMQRWLDKKRDDKLVERLLIAHKRKRVVHSTRRRSMHNIAGKIMLVTALLTALDA